MFEGKPPPPQDSFASDGTTQAGPLRRISWSDLRARLEAARDLRETMHGQEIERLTSFDAHSARRIAARADGKETINPDDLGNGKGSSRINDPAATGGPDSDPRE